MMKSVLGIDTSNYTTSVALSLDNHEIVQEKMLLPVASGSLGLRQSDAVFHHTKQLPQVFQKLPKTDITCIGVSEKPRNITSSYMPCFLTGVGTAEILANALSVPLHKFSHQQGHIAAALYSVNRLDLLDKSFLAYHLSGGTSEVLLVKNGVLNEIEIIGETLDLNAGQVIDRVGKMLDLPFPSGRYIDELALKSSVKKFSIKPSIKGCNFALSGVENKCKNMLDKDKEEVAAYCLEYIIQTIDKVTENILLEYKDMPIVFSGGVSCNTMLKERMQKYNALFAEPVFSADNAAGVAVLARYKEGTI